MPIEMVCHRKANTFYGLSVLNVIHSKDIKEDLIFNNMGDLAWLWLWSLTIIGNLTPFDSAHTASYSPLVESVSVL